MSGKKRYILDIESYRNFFYVGIKEIGGTRRVGFELSDRKPEGFDREWLRRFLMSHQIVTFNGMTYDMPVLWYALNEPNVTTQKIKAISDRIILGNVRYWETADVTGYRLPYEMDHIDLIEPQPNPFASLKILNGRLHGTQMQDLPYEPDADLTHDQMEEVANYCLWSDLDASENLWNAMVEPIELREALGADLGVDLRSKSDTQVGLAIIKHRAEKLLGRRLDRPDVKPGFTFRYKAPPYLKFRTPFLRDMLERIEAHQFIVGADGKVDLPKWLASTPVTIGETTYSMGIGGLHSTESNRAVVADDDFVLVDADVASYYPAIILSLGLAPQAIGPRFLEIYRGIRDDRVKAKKRAKEIKNEIDDLERQIAELEGGHDE
ncbi:hypothetical protein ACFQXB_11680 [Plastorhodobacter daqingensis]|uniref:Uncharacterized protein n=1 Tax=Plastorhodobacter daqingensis TaxID=1387281 RepID=A0ABW2UJF9_9RHOB